MRGGDGGSGGEGKGGEAMKLTFLCTVTSSMHPRTLTNCV